jgi:hypothetical protein
MLSSMKNVVIIILGVALTASVVYNFVQSNLIERSIELSLEYKELESKARQHSEAQIVAAAHDRDILYNTLHDCLQKSEVAMKK